MKIKLLVMDVDGTLTDGQLYLGPAGEIMKVFDVKDGYAISKLLPSEGMLSAIISGRNTPIVDLRAKELNICEVHQGVSDKLTVLKEIQQKYGIRNDSIAYIGDDISDVECMNYCGLSACPNDAASCVKDKASYVCRRTAGHGAVREFIEYISQYNKQQI